MSLGRFTGQEELKKIYDAYVAANPVARPAAAFNNILITTANDGAGIFFSPDEPLFGDENSRKANGAIAKQISQRIIDCIAYYLAQDVAMDNVPSTMRFCMSVCHHNAHWTGLVIELNNFKEIYESFAEHCKNNHLSFGEIGSADDIVIHNRAKNAVLHQLGAVDNENNQILNEETRTRRLFNATKTNRSAVVTINHFDSMNSRAYHKSIQESLEIVTNEDNELIDLARQTCSYQRGNTCGDHTIYNIFSFSHFGETPNLNQAGKNSHTSQDLRDLTNLLANSSQNNNEIATKSAELVSAAFNNATITAEKPTRDKYILVEMATADVVLAIHRVTGLLTPALIHDLGTNKLLNKDKLITLFEEFNVLQNDAANKIVYDDALFANIEKLQTLFLGKHTFAEFESNKDDAAAFGALAYCAAANIGSEIEHEQLRSEQTPISLLKQEIAFDEFSRRPPTPDCSSSDTPDKSSPTLFGDYRLAISTSSSNSDTDIDLDRLLAELDKKTPPQPIKSNHLYAGKIAGTIFGTLIGVGIGIVSFLLTPLTLGGSLVIGGALIVGLAALGSSLLGFSVGTLIDQWRRKENITPPPAATGKNGTTAMIYAKRVNGADLSPQKPHEMEKSFQYPPQTQIVKPKKDTDDAPRNSNTYKPK